MKLWQDQSMSLLEGVMIQARFKKIQANLQYFKTNHRCTQNILALCTIFCTFLNYINFVQILKYMDNLVKKILDFNRFHHLFSSSDRILLAVSGGVDSMVLLDVFCSLLEKHRMDLAVVHLDHQLRPSAEMETQFVQKECENRRIRFYSESIDIERQSTIRKTSLETAAREVRYDFFQRMLKKHSCGKVATGHNAGDQAETVLDRLVRGTGLTGLGGIRPKRGPYIRPLLPVTRREIKDYAVKNNINWIEDESNTDIRYRRNKIRHNLLPVLEKEYNPGIAKSLFRLASSMQETFDFVDHERKRAFNDCLIERTDEKIVLDIIKYLAYFGIVQKYILLYAMELLSGEGCLRFETFEKIQVHFAKKPKLFRPNQHIWMYCSDKELVLYKDRAGIKNVTIDKIPGDYGLWDGYIFEIKRVPYSLNGLKGKKDAFTEYIDPETVELPLKVRPVKKGDRFFPLHFGGHEKKLSDFFVDNKVPLYLRKRIPLVTCRDRIIWIGGYRLDDRFKITERTKTVLKLRLRKDSERI